MGVIENVKVWLWSIAIKKAAIRVVQLFISWLTAQNLAKWGININVNELTAAIFGGLEVLRNWLKTKYNLKFL